MKRATRIFIPVLLALAMLVSPLFSNAAVLGGAGAVYAEEISDTADIVGEDEATNPDLVSDDVNGNSDVIDGTDADVTDRTDADASEEEIKASEDDNESETDVNSEADKDSDAAEAEDAETLGESKETGPVATVESFPGKITDTAKTILTAVKDVAAALVPAKDATMLNRYLSGFIGATGATGGVISALELMGVIKDPTTEQLKEILSLIQYQNQQLKEMNDKMNDLAGKLDTLQAQQVIQNRKSAVLNYCQSWNNFEDHNLSSMAAYYDSYVNWVYTELRAWTYAEEHQDVYAYYTYVYDEETKQTTKQQTYSMDKYNKKMDLETSDSGQTIDKNSTICLPGSYITDALEEYRTNQKWAQATFREDIVTLLANVIANAMNDKKLGCSEAFKTEWEGADARGQLRLAEEAANGLLNSVAYISSYNAVNKNSNESSKLLSQMRATWNATLGANNGIDCQIQALKNYYCFEGEASAEISNRYSYMILLMTKYSTLAQTVATQHETASPELKNTIFDYMTNGTKALEEAKKANITGYSNYCYLYDGGKLAEVKSYKIEGSTYFDTGITNMGVKLYSWSSDKWEISTNGKNISNATIMNSAYVMALYQTWSLTRSGETTSFANYLEKNGLYYNSSVDEIVTSVKIRDFNVNEGIWMRTTTASLRPYATNLLDHPRPPCFFNDDTDYQIMKNCYSKVEEKYFVLSDMVRGSVVSTADGKENPEKILTSRAQYAEGHFYYDNDEAWYLADKEGNTQRNPSEVFTKDRTRFEYITQKYIYVIELSDVPAKTNSEVSSADEQTSETLSGTEEGCNVIDLTYRADTDADILSIEEWEDMDLDCLYIPDTEEIDECIEACIDGRIEEEKAEGRTVTLPEADRTKLVSEIKEMLEDADEEMSDNENLDIKACLDPLGIYGNDAATEKLAKSVLPDSQIATDGQTMQPVKNMITAAFYEPYVYLECEESGDGYAFTPVLTYVVEPELLVWNDGTEDVGFYDISDEVMKNLGLSMTVRLDASEAGDNDIANIVQYDDVYEMNVLNTVTAKIQGSGADRYVEVTVSACSPFSITFSKGGAVNTGDSNNMTLYIIIIVIAGLALASAAFVVVRRRRHAK